ncbi:hypothetical protein CPLU01_14813 [Colletotrichum plurivorum]|uniref:Uncharacterized protein n=1 Tax=Colletotrichum plurivorum TaxID=2175906 RepID=A0A8H6MXK6_9PEZI|nr:hypothetical protein CPLU01_14813 [Colletotrichum plurivorum]
MSEFLFSFPERPKSPPVEVDPQRIPEFEEFKKTVNYDELDSDEQYDALVNRWPDIETRRMYFQWRIESSGIHQFLNPPPLTAEDFWSRLRDTNFVDRGSVAAWNSMMEFENPPFIRIGVSSYGGIHTTYGINPGRVFLVPNRDNPMDSGGDTLADRGILGLNERVWMPEYGPSGPLTENQHGDPVEDGRARPYQAADEDSDTGFVFAQLGMLCAYDWKRTCSEENSDVDGGLWEETGYAVVLRLDKHGVPRGVYVIWEFFDYEPHSGQNYHAQTATSCGTTLKSIGRLHEHCGEEERFSLAKIAPSLSALGESCILSFESQHQTVREHQLVRAMYVKGLEGDDIVVRQFVPQTEGREDGTAESKEHL